LENFFSFIGKVTDVRPSRKTPGGVNLQDFTLAVITNPFWKEKKNIYVKLTCYEENLEILKKAKTGETLNVSGFLDQNGKELRFLVSKIKKEK
jgi:primosomal replication protein N